jgi:hypothetical protein
VDGNAYAGIGSRSTPPGGLAECTRTAQRFAAEGWTLRTGAAPGADQAFERGNPQAGYGCEVYLPWPGFERDRQCAHGPKMTEPAPDAYTVAAEHHPAWGRLGRGAQSLLARNAHIILGEHLDDPCDLVVCWWHRSSGGTQHAISIATAAGVEVVNLAWGTRRLDETLRLQRG